MDARPINRPLRGFAAGPMLDFYQSVIRLGLIMSC